MVPTIQGSNVVPNHKPHLDHLFAFRCIVASDLFAVAVELEFDLRNSVMRTRYRSPANRAGTE
jgi:hypothetical protein